MGPGALDVLADDLVAGDPERCVIVVSDDRVAPLYAVPLCRRLGAGGLGAELLCFPAGEASKTRETKARLEDRLYELAAARDSIVVAVGGGVTGDLAGFLAATWHRGVALIQAPTSLLAMVDAAIGGKTGVNLAEGKNLLGCVHQPLGVYADLRALRTLADREYVGGFAEVIKAGVIADAGLFRWLERTAPSLVGRVEADVGEAVLRSVAIKGRVVARDEREAGRRAILNFGHTVGHALEAASGYRLSHGEAVAIGMCVEARLAAALAGFPREHVRRLDRLVEAFGLPRRPPPGAAFDSVTATTLRDKKVRRGSVRYALPLRLGRMAAGHEVTRAAGEAELRRAWDDAAGGS